MQSVPQAIPSSSELAGKFLWQRGGFESPVACAIVPAGVVAVADSSGEFVGVSALDGSILWRTKSAGDEKLVEPSAVAALPDGSFLLCDRRRGRVEHYATSGAWIKRFAADTFFGRPGSIAVGTAGVPPLACVAIVDDASGEIVICSETGEVIRRIGRETFKKKDGSICTPSGIAFAGFGRLVATAAEQNHVFVFEPPQGSDPVRVLQVWGGRGPFPGLFNHPLGVASDGNWIFVADQYNHRISRQDARGQGQLAYGQHAVRPREGEGAVHYPTAIAVCRDVSIGSSKRSLAVVCEPFERRIQAFEPGLDAEPVDIRLVLPKLDGVQSHFGDSVAREGQRLFMHDPESCSIVVFDLSKGQPLHVSNVGSAGAKPHEFGSIDAMVGLAGGTRLLVADGINRRLALWELTPPPKEIIFEPFMARLVKTRPYDRLGLPAGTKIVGLARGPNDLVLALSEEGPSIVTLDSSLRTETAAPISAPDTTARPCSIAIGQSGVVGVLFDRPAILCLYVREGLSWRSTETRTLADVACANGLVAMPNDEWLVVDSWGDSVTRLNSEGTASRTGSRGVADGQLWLPGAATIGSGGEIYVVDGGNHRAQRFSSSGDWEMTFSLGRTYTRARTADEVLRIRKKTDGPVAIPEDSKQ